MAALLYNPSPPGTQSAQQFIRPIITEYFWLLNLEVKLYRGKYFSTAQNIASSHAHMHLGCNKYLYDSVYRKFVTLAVCHTLCS